MSRVIFCSSCILMLSGICCVYLFLLLFVIIIIIWKSGTSVLANHKATTSCKSTWDTVQYFGINGLSMILCLWSPSTPYHWLLAIQDHAQNLEEQLWMGGRREVSIISHTPVTRSDLKQEWSFFVGIVSTFLQLVVENPPHKQWLVICSNKGLLYLLTCGINRRLPYSKRILLQLRCYRLCRPNFDYGKLKIINTDLISPLFY